MGEGQVSIDHRKTIIKCGNLTNPNFHRTDEQNTALSALPKSECNVEKSVLNPMADEFIPRSHVLDFPAS